MTLAAQTQRIRRLATAHPWPAWLWDCLSGGVLGGLLFSGVFAVLALVLLAWLHRRVARSTDAGTTFRCAFRFALAFFAVHLSWLSLSMTDVLGPVGGALTVLVLPAAALTWTVPLALIRWAAGPRTLLALPFAWVVTETLRTTGPFAFPWGAPGYALSGVPLVQLASLGGVSLLTLPVTLTASVIAGLGPGGHPAAAVSYPHRRPRAGGRRSACESSGPLGSRVGAVFEPYPHGAGCQFRATASRSGGVA